MAGLYIASDRRGSGRTALTAGIATLLEAQGFPVRVAKPLYLREATGPQEDPDREDYRRLGLDLPGAPIAVTPQQLENGLRGPLQVRIEASLPGGLPEGEVTILEGLPGVDPADPVARASAELSALLDARVIVVAHFAPGFQADTLDRAHQLFGNRLLGIVINGVSRHQAHWARTTLASQLQAQGVPVLGIIPEDRCLMGIRVRDIAQELHGELLQGEEQADVLVEHLMLGANVLDDSTLYFQQRAHKAVLVRGDRPDIQMGALATPTACLVLTAGKDPVQYVQYEAEQEGVPIIRVSQPTLQAAEALNGLMARARFDHPRKLERYQELLRQHLTWEPIRRALSG